MNLGLASLARPFVDGTTILADKATAWVTRPALLDVPEDAPEGAEPEPDKRAPVKRLALLGAAGYVVLASDYTTYAVGAGCAGWGVAALALGYRSPDRDEEMPDSSATPPPEEAPPSGDVYAGGSERVAGVEYDPSGVRCTIHVKRDEVDPGLPH